MEYELRPWELRDATSLAANFNNIAVWSNVGDNSPFPFTAKDGKKYLEELIESKNKVHYAILIDGNACGGVVFTKGEDVFRLNASIAFWLGEDYWNKGVMTNVLTELVRILFFHRPIIKVNAQVFANNQAAMRVLENVGFKREGVVRNAVIKNGDVLDLVLYGMCEEDRYKNEN